MQKSLGKSQPTVHESAFVSEMAYLVGDVSVAPRASVWPFVCIRGDYGPTSVGEASNVQDFTMLHEAVVGKRVTIGHNAVLDRTEVGDSSLIGMSSTLLPDTTVEENAIVAGGTVVREGQTVPEGHLAYGVPAETKPLTEEQREQISWYCEEYLELADRYKSAGVFE